MPLSMTVMGKLGQMYCSRDGLFTASGCTGIMSISNSSRAPSDPDNTILDLEQFAVYSAKREHGR
jgi:hypothetical protein